MTKKAENLNTPPKPSLDIADVSGSALVEVDKYGIVKIPKDCGIVTSIVYDNYKYAQIVEQSPNYDFFRLQFWEDDRPKQVTINWVTPTNYKSRFCDNVETHYR